MPDARHLYRFWGRTPPKDGPDAPKLLRVVPRADVAGDTETTAKLYIYGPIDSWGGFWGVSAAEVAEALTQLPAGTTEIELHLNSPGGEVFEGVAIMNLLRDHDARITAKVDGLAASAASFLAASADELIMGRNTELMIHDAWGISIGNAKDMRAYADLLDRVSDDSADVYAAKAGGTRESWREYMRDGETWFSAEEAVAAGLADAIAGADSVDDADADTAAAAKARFDTAALFQYAERGYAPVPKPVPTAPAASSVPPPAAPTQAAGTDISLRHRHNARKLQLTAAGGTHQEGHTA